MAPKLIRAFGEQQESTKESTIWILYMTVMSISNSLEVRIEIPSCSRISIDTDVNLNYLNLILANFLLHSLWSEPRISGNHCSMIIPRIKGFSFWEYGGSAPLSVSTWFQLYKKETLSYWIRKETCSDEDSTVKAFKRHLPTSIKPPWISFVGPRYTSAVPYCTDKQIHLDTWLIAPAWEIIVLF